MPMFRSTATCLLLALLLVSAGSAFGATTIVLVRHAEKGEGRDPSLTDDGVARARALAHVITDLGIEAVYATQYLRTRETGQPLAEQLGHEVTVLPVEGDLEVYNRALVERLRSEHAEGSALVVGHSNTVPALIRALGVGSAPELGEGDYDDLFVVTITEQGDATLLHLHYGAPSH